MYKLHHIHCTYQDKKDLLDKEVIFLGNMTSTRLILFGTVLPSNR